MKRKNHALPFLFAKKEEKHRQGCRCLFEICRKEKGDGYFYDSTL